MRLEQLQYFEILTQEGSFTKAAEQLHISQPSLTASIKAMEKELEVPLLVRNTRSFSLTEEGEQVLAFAKDTLASYQSLLHNLHPPKQQAHGELSIVASKFFCEIILEQFLPLLRNRYTEMKVRLIEHEYHAVPTNLPSINFNFAVLARLEAQKDDKIDFVDLVSDEAFFLEQYHYLPLFTDSFGLCIAKTSALSELPVIYPNKIDTTQYPATTFPFGISTFSDDLYLVTNNPKLHIDALLQEHAFCSVPYFVYKHLFIEEKELTYRAYSNDMFISYHLIYPADHVLTEAEQLFVDELQDYLSQMKFK